MPPLGIGFVSDGASIDDTQLGALTVCGLSVTVGFQHFLDVLRLVLVNLATEGYEAAGARLQHAEILCVAV